MHILHSCESFLLTLQNFFFLLGMLQNASESLFNYTLDLNKGSFNDSQHRNFIPTSVPASDIDILSALNQTSQMENGLSHCNHSLACLQDFFITRNENFSESVSIKDTIKAQIYLLGKHTFLK